MAIVVLIMFYNTAMNSATSVIIFWRAFVLNPPGGAADSFEQITNWAVVMKEALIILPLWRAVRAAENFAFNQYGNNTRFKLIMHIILESGLLYTTVAFMTFVTYTVKHNSLYVISRALVPITGIAFNLIIIRTSRAAEAENLANLTGSSTRQPLKLSNLHKSTGRHVDNIVDHQVQVFVTKDTTHDPYPGPHTNSVKSSSQDLDKDGPVIRDIMKSMGYEVMLSDRV
ncbi:hypothetical protein C0995_000395 [Termitomyces sp. Mi166|nr:hypothetical protein C0995_000395 [Termitomyces sp. Mi166\